MALPRVKRAGIWTNPVSARFKASGTWVRPKSLWQRVSGAWVKVWNSFELTVGLQNNQTIGGGNIRHSRTVSPSPHQSGNSYAYYLVADSSGIATISGGTVSYVTPNFASLPTYVTVECIVTGPDAGTYSISFEITG